LVILEKNDDELIRFAGDEVVLEPRDDEVVVFKSFFGAGLRFPLYEMIGEVLKKFEIYLHQLTPNDIIRLSMYIWALRRQGRSANAERFCRVHELHYQTEARADGMHKNFGCYNFAYRKDMKAPVIGYRTKWPTGWTSEWFYVKADKKQREKLMSMVMSPWKLNFGMTRPLCNMQLGSPSQLAKVEFKVVVEHISTRDLVQEYLAYKTFPTSGGWGMPKKKDEGKKFELVRLPYRFNFMKTYSGPCAEWLEAIETMYNKIIGNYTKKEDQLTATSFGTREKRRLNRVMDALGFEYPDYDRLNEETGGVKNKRVVSILKRQAQRSIEKDKNKRLTKRLKLTPESSSSKKRKIMSSSREEGERSSPSKHSAETPTTTSIGMIEILEVMTEPLPFTMLSPLGSELTSLEERC
jgi:hypothetical protein